MDKCFIAGTGRRSIYTWSTHRQTVINMSAALLYLTQSCTLANLSHKNNSWHGRRRSKVFGIARFWFCPNLHHSCPNFSQIQPNLPKSNQFCRKNFCYGMRTHPQPLRHWPLALANKRLLGVCFFRIAFVAEILEKMLWSYSAY